MQIQDRRLTAWGLPSGRSKSKPMWPADRVVFLNDVYFCAADAVRLLQHEGDMVCGLDFDRPKLEEMPGDVGSSRTLSTASRLSHEMKISTCLHLWKVTATHVWLARGAHGVL